MKQHLSKKTHCALILTDRALSYDGRLAKIVALCQQNGSDVKIIAFNRTYSDFVDTVCPPTLPARLLQTLFTWLFFLLCAAVICIAAHTIGATNLFVSSVVSVGVTTVLSALYWDNQLSKTVTNFLKFRVSNRFIEALGRRIDPDIIISIDVIALPVASRIKFHTQARHVYDAHEYFRDEVPGDQEREAWVRKVELKYGDSVDGFVTVNDSLAQLYNESDAPFPNAIVVRNAAIKPKNPIKDDGRLHRAANLTPETRILMYHGGLAPLRGLSLLAESVPDLPDGWAIVVMGIGDPTEWFQHISPQLKLIPPKPQGELLHWLAGADLGAILYEPGSLNQKYCSPNKLWEYPAAGVPLIASDLPELRRVIDRYSVGYVLSEKPSKSELIATLSSLSLKDIVTAKSACYSFSDSENWDVEASKFKQVLYGT